MGHRRRDGSLPPAQARRASSLPYVSAHNSDACSVSGLVRCVSGDPGELGAASPAPVAVAVPSAMAHYMPPHCNHGTPPSP